MIIDTENQTHYQILHIDKNASPEMIELAYAQLLKDAKEKLGDSPIYYEKEKILNEAYAILSNAEHRQAYDKKMANDEVKKMSHDEPVGKSTWLENFTFIKGFAVFVVLVIALLVLLPSGEDRGDNQTTNKKLDNNYDIQQQNMDLQRQKERRLTDAEQRRLDLQEQREQAKIDREERRLKMQEEREERYARNELKRENERIQRKKEYERKKRSQELIRQANRTKYTNYDRSKSGGGSMGR